MTRLHRSISWGVLVALLALFGVVLITELDQWRKALAAEAESVSLDLMVARRLADKLPELEAAAAAQKPPPDEQLFWQADTAQSGLLDFQETVTNIAQNEDLTVLRIEPFAPQPLPDGQTALTLRFTGEGNIADVQQVLFLLERHQPRITVTALALKPRPDPRLLEAVLNLTGVQSPQ